MPVRADLVDVWPNPIVFGGGHTYDRVMNDAGMAKIKRWETFQPKKYPDGVDAQGKPQWAICYGHSGKTGVGPTQQEIAEGDFEFTEPQGLAMLKADLEVEFLPALDRLIDCNINTYMFNGVAIFAYNLGITRFRRTLVLEKLNQGKYIAACAAFLVDPEGRSLNNRQRNAEGILEVRNGLTCRRADEMSLFLTKVD